MGCPMNGGALRGLLQSPKTLSNASALVASWKNTSLAYFVDNKIMRVFDRRGNKCLIQIFISILSFLYKALRAMYIYHFPNFKPLLTYSPQTLVCQPMNLLGQKLRWWFVCIQGLFSPAYFQFSSVQFSSVQFNSIQFSSVQFRPVQFSSDQFSSDQFSSVQTSSVQFRPVQFSSDLDNTFTLTYHYSFQFSSLV